MKILDEISPHFRYVALLFGLFMLAKAYSCTSNTVVHKRNGDDVTLHFQARTMHSEGAKLTVANMILSPNGSQLINVLYRNGNNIMTSDCNGCTFSGSDATGDMSVRLSNVRSSAGGTYKHAVNSGDNVLECVTVYILGIPTKPVLTVDKDPSVGEIVTLTCSSNSTTTPSNHGLSLTYTWAVDNKVNPSDSRYSYSTNYKTMTLSSVVKEDDNKNVACTASEDVIDGHTSSSSDPVSLNVFYPPDGPPNIAGYSNGGTYKVIENKTGLLTCSLNGGNPLATLNWDCYKGGSPAVTVGTTVIKNVTWIASRDQERPCTCQSSHVIAGKQHVSVNIQVLYQTSVTSFFVKGHEGEDNAVVDEHDDINFICVADSDPESSIKITFENNTLQEVSHTKSLSFIRKNVVCLHGGVYTCEGSNGIGKPSIKTIQLLVRCSPRPLHQIKGNVSSPMGLPVTVSLTVLAYPEPGPTGYSWHKEVGTRWTPLLSNADLLISSSGLQTNLSIHNVSQSDYGQYRVTAKNSLGTYEQFLFLTENQKSTSITTTIKATGVDDTPTDKTAIIVGVTLGVFSFVVVVYATVVTIILRRKTTKKGTNSLDKATSQTTYANVGYNSNVTEEQGQANIVEINDPKGVEDDPDKQYTSLDPVTSPDKQYTSLDPFTNPDKQYTILDPVTSPDKQYTSLDPVTREDNVAYEVIQTESVHKPGSSHKPR